jgi:cytochrome c peroxidase
MSEAKVELGRHLFYDPKLSFNSKIACASCHQHAYGFAEPLMKSIGATGQPTKRNTLALINVAYNGSLTWANDSFTRIEHQLLAPLFAENRIEMGLTGYEEEVLARFNTPTYHKLVESAFPGESLTMDNVVKALASFVRSLVSFNSPFDRYAYQGEDDALSESALRGMELFFSERLECFHCHGGFTFTQSNKHAGQQLDLRPFHNVGLYNENGIGAYPVEDQGLIEHSFNQNDMGKFRAPTLRNVAVTAPYMHDGSVTSLVEVIDFYAAGGRGEGVSNPYKSMFIRRFHLSEQEKQDLIDFLHSLTDAEFLSNPAFSSPQ